MVGPSLLDKLLRCFRFRFRASRRLARQFRFPLGPRLRRKHGVGILHQSLTCRGRRFLFGKMQPLCALGRLGFGGDSLGSESSQCHLVQRARLLGGQLRRDLRFQFLRLGQGDPFRIDSRMQGSFLDALRLDPLLGGLGRGRRCCDPLGMPCGSLILDRRPLAGRTRRLGIAFFALTSRLRGLLLFLDPLSRCRQCRFGGTHGLGRPLRCLDFPLSAFFFLPRQVVFAFRPPALGLDLFRSGLLGLARQRQGGLFGGKPLLGGKGRLRFDFAVLGTLPG